LLDANSLAVIEGGLAGSSTISIQEIVIKLFIRAAEARAG
jgi:hypothetical protein